MEWWLNLYRKQFLHCVFDELVGRGQGYHQFGSAQDLNPVVATWKEFLALSVGLQVPTLHAGFFPRLLVLITRRNMPNLHNVFLMRMRVL